jgi:hypothetical protein
MNRLRIILSDALLLVRAGLQRALEPLGPATEFIEAADYGALERELRHNRRIDLLLADAALAGTGLQPLLNIAVRAGSGRSPSPRHLRRPHRRCRRCG